jgi:hypothetical protein
MTWRYYKLPVAGGGHFFVRIDEEQEIAEWREVGSSRWVRQDAYFGEVYFNGQGSPCLAAEALAAVPA